MIDWNRVRHLQREIGPDGFDAIVDVFIEEVSETVERLRTAPDPDTLCADLHALKGSALTLGFTTFSDMCQRGETRAGQAGAQDVAVLPILDCYEDSKNAFFAGLETGELTQ